MKQFYEQPICSISSRFALFPFQFQADTAFSNHFHFKWIECNFLQPTILNHKPVTQNKSGISSTDLWQNYSMYFAISNKHWKTAFCLCLASTIYIYEDISVITWLGFNLVIDVLIQIYCVSPFWLKLANFGGKTWHLTSLEVKVWTGNREIEDI